MKEKLNVAEQIQNLKNKGLSFDIVNEKDAERILSNSTYFLR